MNFPRTKDDEKVKPPVAKKTPSAQILVSKYQFLLQRSHWASLEKWLTPGLGQIKHKISLIVTNRTV